MSVILRSRTVRPDWWTVITDLMGRGLTHSEIGKRCGVDASSITRLRNNNHAQPLFGTGVRLLALWLDVCERNVNEVPEIRVR